MGKRIWVLLSRPDECGNRSAIVVGAYATVEAAEAAIVDELGDAVERDADSLGVTLSDSDGVILGYLQAVEVDGEGELASLVRPAPDPAAIDATDETRLAAGWRQQVVCGDDDVEPSASTAAPPDGWAPAAGVAGRWRYRGSVGSALGIYSVWFRWLAPAEAAPVVRTHWLRNWRPVCGAPATEPSARVLDQERTCLRCLEVVDGAFDAVEVSRG